MKKIQLILCCVVGFVVAMIVCVLPYRKVYEKLNGL